MKKSKSLFVGLFMGGMLAVLAGCADNIDANGVDKNSGATLGEAFQPDQSIPADKAAIYIYRPGVKVNAAAETFSFFIGGNTEADNHNSNYYDVRANDKFVTTLVDGGYYLYLAKPGAIQLAAVENDLSANGFGSSSDSKVTFSTTIDAKAGHKYYIKGTYQATAMCSGLLCGDQAAHAKLQSVPSEEGLKDITECCKLIHNNRTQ